MLDALSIALIIIFVWMGARMHSWLTQPRRPLYSHTVPSRRYPHTRRQIGKDTACPPKAPPKTREMDPESSVMEEHGGEYIICVAEVDGLNTDELSTTDVLSSMEKLAYSYDQAGQDGELVGGMAAPTDEFQRNALERQLM